MKHIFTSKKAIGITSLVLATSVVLGTIAINRKKDGGVSVGIPTVNAADAYLSYDSASLVNYSSVLGRAVDFGIVTNRLEQRNHMETTYATNDFYNQKNDNCDVDLAGTAPAQFIIASISGGKARFGYTYGAKNDYQTAPSMQFVIDTTPDLASSDLFTYDAGSFKGEALYRTFTEPDLKSNVNGMIQHFKDESDKMLQHVAFDGDAVFNASTGAIDFSDECYKNTTLYINVQPGSRLESAIQATEGLNIIKDPSTVVVFNILNTDYIKLAKYKVTSDNMTMDTYTDHSGDDSEKNKNIDKYITRKIIWNVPYAKSVDYDTTAGLFLVPNPDTTGTVTTSSAGWIAAAGTTVVKGGEFHYIFHDRSEDANTPDTSVMHFALRKAFVEDGTPADQIKSKEIRNILVGAGEYTFTIEETDENYNKLTDSNAYTDEKSTDAYGKVVFKSLSETVREVDPYNGKHRYFVIKEKTMAPGVDSHISQSNGEIRIDVLVTNVNGIIHYQVSSWKYADGNNLTDSGIIATNDKVDMSGTEFSLGGFYNYYDLKYAKLSVTKNVNVTGTDDFPADQKFNFALKIDGKYVQNEQGELGLTPRYFEITRDQKIDFTHLIPGTYTIEENPDDIQGFTFLSKEVQVGSSVMANDQVVLGDDDDVDATLVNNYQKVDIDGKFSLKVKKNVDVHFPAGMARDMSDFEGKEFHFTVKLGDQYVQDKNGTLGSQEKVFTINYDTSVQGPGAVGNEFTIYGLDPNATYTVTEVRDQNYTGDNAYVAMPGYTYTSNANETTKNVRLDQDGKRAEIVNKYDVQKGKLTVNKSFTLIDDNNANGSGSVDTTSLSNLNNLTFTVKGPLGFSKTITYEDITAGRNVFENVPAGKYTIIEENASETSGGNYTFVRYTYVGSNGSTEVGNNENKTITVYNQYRENYSTTEKGNITIAKSMDGAVAPAGSVFNFTIKNSLGEYCEFDAEGNFVGFTTTKTYASLTFPAGSGYYSSREFKNIPTGSYTVEEEPTDEQKTLEGKNLKVEYMVDGVSTQSFKLENYGNKQVQVNNHYREYMLEVEKLVSGDIPYDYSQYDMEYSFVIKKGDQYVQPNGNLTGTAYTFKIKPNQKMQIPVTDAGDYQVIETTTEPENSLFTLTTTYSTVNGEVTLNSANKDDSVIIHNNYTYKNKGSLEVKKEVSDPTNSAPAGTEFTVGVKINRTASFDVDFPDGTTSSVAFEKDVVKEFTLKAGESIKINGLYAGTEYEVTESNIPSDYSLASNGIVYGNTEKKITKDTEDLVTVNNKYDNIQEYFTLSVEKNWDDANNQDGKRPTEVVVILKQDGNEIDRTTLNDSNNWTYTATNLPKYNGTSEYVYTWEEVPVANYTTTYSPAAPIPNGTTTVTNSYTPETTSATVTKKWVDFDNAAGKRPTEIVMTLTNGDTVKLNAGNNWTATISGLPKYSNGVLINYTWTEENMPQGYSQTDYTTLGTTTTIENTYDISLEKTTMKVTKVWDDNNDQDGMRPQNLTVTLRKNNVDFLDVVLNDSNNWTAELNTLAKFDDQGALITYEWVEPAVTGYTSVSSGTVADRVFTNTHAPEKISLSVEKIWDDNNNQDGKRPADITVILKKDSADFMTFTLNDGNGWKETASDLDKYENGREIAYEWAEVTVPEYTTTTSEAKGVTTITNKHVPETVSVAVAKTWVDDNNRDGKRPASLNVTLKKDGTDFEVIELNDGNSWSYSRSDLPKYENGALIDYSWEEESVADYTSEKTGVAASTTFTNTHETEKVSLTVTKTWVNTGNSAAQPSSVVVDLLADGTPVGSVTLNDGNNWTDSISDLPVYENGVKINYEWKEQVPANYQDTYTGNGTASTTIKNTYDHSVERTTAKVTKIWDDSNNQDGKRPTEVEVQLMQNGVAFGSSVRLDEASGWTYEATDLPKYDANGDEYTYTWEETPVTDYTLTENSTAGTETTLKNSYTTETVDLKITKTWIDNNDITGNRPISVDVNLLVNGTAGRTVTLKASENWTAEVTGLAKYSNGTEITYTWEEVVPANYNPSYSGNGTADVEITNAYDFSVERTTAKVTKTWDDSNNQDGKRPTEVEVQLMQNGVAFGSSVRLDEASGWTYEATDLPKYDVNGDEYTYTWEETPVTDYTLTENNTAGTETTLKNTHTAETTDMTVTKTWVNTGNSSAQPTSVVVDLLADGTPVGSVTLNDGNNWTDSISDLPVYENGVKINYEWKEQVPANYQDTYTGNGTASTTIKNTYDHSVERTTAKVTKIWNDSNNQDGKRPTEVEVQLMQNGVAFGSSVRLDEASGWTYEATDLPKFDGSGNEYVYTWEETPLPDYTLTDNTKTGTETILTNSHVTETVSLKITKTWADADNKAGKRPASVDVKLLVNGTAGRTVTLTAAEGWTKEVTGLAKYSNGRAISYTWEEVVPADYTPAYSGNGTADAVINNSFDFSTVKTTATVTKSWSDNNDQDGKRPTSVTVQLLRDGTACGNPVNLTAADSWTYTESNLEKYDTAGNEYKYTWEEVSVPAGYTMSGNVTSGTDTTITNAHTTETTSLVVKKTWVNTGNSSAQPASVDVDLYKGTTKIGTVTLDASNNWEESIGGLPVYENGTKITYEWKEIVPADYKVSYSGNGTASTTITNTFDHAVVKTEAKVTKVWSDNNDQDGKRPTEVKVQLKQNNVDYGAEVTLNAGNNWTYTKSQLPKFDDNGNEYTYTWDEVSVPSGYIKTVSGTGADTVITNTHTAETTTMTVKKTWVNTGNSAAQPASVVVDLMNGTTKVGSVTLSAANNWEDKISDLPVYTAGLKNNYEWQEQVPANYSATYTGNGTASTVVTNTYNFTAVKTTAKVTKVWDDDNDRDGKRPTTLQVQLLQNGSALGSPVTLDAASGWTYEVTDLQKFDANGNAYSYTWEESSVPADYSQTGNSTSGTETTITNAHTVATTQLTVKKTWVNTGNSSAQPTSVVVDLMNGTTKVGSVTLDDSNNWEDSISNLPVNENGSAITYEWKEQVPTNYKESYSVSGTTTTITNTFDISSEKTEATVKKVWDDNNNQDGKRPTEVTVRLLRNGTPIGSDILLNDGNNWEYKAENLDKMDASGNAYAYTWEEDAVTGYSASKSESGTVTTFTNKHVPETKILTVEKIWDDANNVAGVRPTELVMTLSSGGSVTLNEQNGWTASVNVPVYANGSEIAYSWSEGTMPAGYTKESCVVNGNITTFTNKFDLSTVKTSVSVAKVWDDNSDAAGARPTELIVSLSDGTQVVDQATLNDANGWKYTANDLAMYDASGNVITYTWSEGAMPSGYALTDTTVNAGVTTFTNTYTAPVQVKGSLKIEKVLGPDAPASAATKAYHFTVTCPDGSTIPVEIVGASYVELNDLALGDYKITEDEADAKISGYDLSILNNDATVTLTDAAQKSVTVTNNYTQQQTTPAPTTPAPTTPAPTGTKTTQDASSETSETAPSEQPSETTATPTPTKEIESITIDDKPIKPEDFEKKPDGSIELKPETIDELTLGVHRMRITYTDGSAITVEFEVVSSATRPGGKTVVKTGDTGTDRTPVVAILFIAVAAVVLLILRKRTKKEHEIG
ncbi:MAG: Cna B-type domain-containing protein [Clostridiales bacterium]|nr:Cna B-type domain-containing protein [Clostridiales bacterium]